MFTSNSTLLSRDITTIITNSFGAIGNIFDRTLNQIIKSLFSNNEQGFAYDPNDLTTMFQDAAGTVPVTAMGQAVGLIRDKSGRNNHASQATSASRPIFRQKPILGSELVTNRLISGNPATGAIQYYSMAGKMPLLSAGKTYIISYTVKDYTGTGNVGLAGDAPAGVVQKNHATNGVYSSIQTPTANGYFVFYTSAANTANFSNISVKEITGYRTDQNYLEYDGVDDKLTTTLPTQLTGCTVIRSAPNVGTQILTGQTIPATYGDNKVHCGLLVINRALTPSETSAITSEFNKRAGV